MFHLHFRFLSLKLTLLAHFEAGMLPDWWHDAILSRRPAAQNGATSKPVNYRPIYLSCIYCLAMEREMNQDLLDFLRTKGLVNQTQHGFHEYITTGPHIYLNTRFVYCVKRKAVYENGKCKHILPVDVIASLCERRSTSSLIPIASWGSPVLLFRATHSIGWELV